MHEIDHPTAVAGQFTEGNAGGTPATVLTADWLNNLQNELAGIVVASGAALDKTKNDQVLKALMNLVYPVGTVYISQRLDVTPFQLFGVGEWQIISKGRVPVGLDADQVEFDTIGKQGGAKTHELTEEELPEVSLKLKIFDRPIDGSGDEGDNTVSLTGDEEEGYIVPFGGGQPHNNLQPYEVIGRVWKRTA